jgi:hypothetical protein
MAEFLRRWWPYARILLGLTALAIIGTHFAFDLLDRRIWERTLRPGWIVLSGLLYLVGLFFSALTWRRLLTHFGQPPRLIPAVRAYYLGHLAKYLPGKAWALFWRADLIRNDGVRFATGLVTAFYEVLVTMSGAVVVSAILFALFAPDTGHWPHGAIVRGLLRLQVPAEGEVGRTTLLILSLGLLALVGTPAVPPIFNRLASRIYSPFAGGESLPRVRWRHLGEGLVLTSTGWLFQGASLVAALASVPGTNVPWTLPVFGMIAAVMGVSYVAGFVILLLPSGLGVREYFLSLLLAPELRASGSSGEEARALAILTVLVLRVAWTAAELVMAGAVWRLGGQGPEKHDT